MTNAITYLVADSDTGAMVLGRAATEEDAIRVAKEWAADHGIAPSVVGGVALMLATLDSDPDINSEADLAEGTNVRAWVVRYAEPTLLVASRR